MGTCEHIEIKKTARYYVEGKLGPNTEEVWMVCHGYGYMAEYFIKYFTGLASETCCVVAPEALNKFYKDGMGGDVGASWMTKSDRLNEIEDYVNYLDQLLKVIMKDLDVKKVKLNILGFSQGTAAVCRWITMRDVAVDNLIIWAGDIPNDIDFQKFNQVLEDRPLHLIVGDTDKFISQQIMDQFALFLKGKSVNYMLHRYDGGHKIQEALLLELAAGFRNG